MLLHGKLQADMIEYKKITCILVPEKLDIKNDITVIHKGGLLMKRNIFLIVFILMCLTGCDTKMEPNKKIDNSEIMENQTRESVPDKSDVEKARDIVLNGMTEDQIEKLSGLIKKVNMQLEKQYLNDNCFASLKDKDSLKWNYYHKVGEIQVGWAFEDEIYDNKEQICRDENLTEDEFCEKYGTEVMAYNEHNAEYLIKCLEEMKEGIINEALKTDIKNMISVIHLILETNGVEHVINLYKMVHDMDYFLLRYGPEDVGIYMSDSSLVCTFYDTLSVYKD